MTAFQSVPLNVSLRLGTVDEIRTYVHPVILGAGTPMFPPLDAGISLQLIDTQVFGSKVVMMKYEVLKP